MHYGDVMPEVPWNQSATDDRPGDLVGVGLEEEPPASNVLRT